MSLVSSRMRLSGSVAALLVGVAAGLGLLVPAPAQAAACGGSSGVTVIVDFAELGGGVTAGCAPESGRARGVFAAAGYALNTATKSPSFVCRVNGLPADDPCVDAAPADAYWSLWWANGQGGSWVYSSLGVDALKVPDGAYVAFAWHQGSGKSQPPATVPVPRTEETKKPAPTKKPGPVPTQGPAKKPDRAPDQAPEQAPGAPATGASTPGAVAPTSAASPSAVASGAATPSPTSDVPSPGESVPVDPDLPDADQITAGPDDVVQVSAESDGLPGWVAPAVAVLLLAAVAGVALVRRRRA